MTPALGDLVTLVIKWGGAPAISVNGAAFVSDGALVESAITATSFDIGTSGTVNANREIDSDIFWSAAGRGTLTDADAAAIHAFGNTDPMIQSFPGQPTFFWDGRTATFQRSA